MDIETAIASLLASSQAVHSICGNRIYATIMPDGLALPAITYQLITESPDSTLDGPGTFNEVRLQIDCWSTVSGQESRQLASAVISVLDGLSATVSGIQIWNVMRDGAQDLFEADKRLWRRSTDFKLQFAV